MRIITLPSGDDRVREFVDDDRCLLFDDSN